MQGYRARIGGPLLDRIDLHVDVPALPARDVVVTDAPDAEASAVVRARVTAAREVQRLRLLGAGAPASSSESRASSASSLASVPLCNAQMDLEAIQKHCEIGADSQALLEKAVTTFSLSARGVHRTLRVARTIADLEGAEKITRAHVAEAAHHRMVEPG